MWILVGLVTRWFIIKIEGNISIVLHEKKLIVFYQKIEKLRLKNDAGFFLKRRKYLLHLLQVAIVTGKSKKRDAID